MAGIANQTIPIILLPERPRFADAAVDFPGRKPFPRFHNFFEPVGTARTEKHMNVIGHHHEGSDVIAFAVEVPYRVRNQSREFRVTQNA